jgi:uncharacterized protein (DUF427 family)
MVPSSWAASSRDSALPDELASVWQFRGTSRPSFAEEPGPGQESVWDYPRPPAILPDSRRVIVKAGSVMIADSECAVRILETASPPTFYIPPADVDQRALQPAPGSSYCEWKGTAAYYRFVNGVPNNQPIGWNYPQPSPGFIAIAGFYSFYPGRVECYVDGERVRPQPGGFYGGWITDEIVGPVKGEPGTGGW